jgi:hypothetical protein
VGAGRSRVETVEKQYGGEQGLIYGDSDPEKAIELRLELKLEAQVEACPNFLIGKLWLYESGLSWGRVEAKLRHKLR